MRHSGSVAASYRYDGADRRKSVAGTTTRFLHAGAMEIAEHDGAGTLLRRFIPGAGIDERVAMVEASTGAVSYFHENRLGSVVALSNAAADRYAYSPWGEGPEASPTPT